MREMVAYANAVEVLFVLSMITSCHTLVGEKVNPITFNCFVENAIEVNPMDVIVKSMANEWEKIVVTENHHLSITAALLVCQLSVRALRKKEEDARKKQPTVAEGAICMINSKFKKTYNE